MATKKTTKRATNNGGKTMDEILKGLNYGDVFKKYCTDEDFKDLPFEARKAMADTEWAGLVEVAKAAVLKQSKETIEEEQEIIEDAKLVEVNTTKTKTKKVKQESKKDMLEIMTDRATTAGKIAAGTMYSVYQSYESDLEDLAINVGCMIENIGDEKVKEHLKKGTKSALCVGLAKLVKDQFADDIIGLDYLTDGVMVVKGVQAVYHFYCATSRILKVTEEQKKTYKERNLKIYDKKIADMISKYQD